MCGRPDSGRTRSAHGSEIGRVYPKGGLPIHLGLTASRERVREGVAEGVGPGGRCVGGRVGEREQSRGEPGSWVLAASVLLTLCFLAGAACASAPAPPSIALAYLSPTDASGTAVMVIYEEGGSAVQIWRTGRFYVLALAPDGSRIGIVEEAGNPGDGDVLWVTAPGTAAEPFAPPLPPRTAVVSMAWAPIGGSLAVVTEHQVLVYTPGDWEHPMVIELPSVAIRSIASTWASGGRVLGVPMESGLVLVDPSKRLAVETQLRWEDVPPTLLHIGWLDDGRPLFRHQEEGLPALAARVTASGLVDWEDVASYVDPLSLAARATDVLRAGYGAVATAIRPVGRGEAVLVVGYRFQGEGVEGFAVLESSRPHGSRRFALGPGPKSWIAGLRSGNFVDAME